MKMQSLLRSTCDSIWNWIGCNRFLLGGVALGAALSGTVWWCDWDWLGREWSCGWNWLRNTSNGMESGSTTVRNLGIVFGGFVAICVAIWRGVVADRQAKTAQYQAEISWRSLLHERYQKGTDMLLREDISVRLVGIHELQNLAEVEPERYHLAMTRVLCTFVKHPTKDEGYMATLKASKQHLLQRRADVQAALTAIGNRSDAAAELERRENYRINLAGAFLVRADLAGADLTDVDLNGANLTEADLTGAHLAGVNLTGTHLAGADLDRRAKLVGAKLGRKNLPEAIKDDPRLDEVIEPIRNNTKLDEIFLDGADLTKADLARAFLINADLTGVSLEGSNLAGADLLGANLSGASLNGVKGLTQDQLDQACADFDNPPKLAGTHDSETGVPLEWRGQPCRE